MFVNKYIMKKLILTTLLMLASTWCFEQSKENFSPLIETEYLDTVAFSKNNLVKYILSKKIQHPHIVYAQSILETGEFTSTIFKENNNLFGMKYVGDFRALYRRPTTAIGSRYNHAIYTDWKKSVDDYVLWQQMFKKTAIDKEDDYFKLLGWKYATDPRYVSSVKIIIKKYDLKNIANEEKDRASI